MRRRTMTMDGFNIDFVNAHSARHKVAEIHAIISESVLNILLVCETWIQPNAPNAVGMEMAPPSYKVVNVLHNDSRLVMMGGLAVIYKDHLKSRQ